MKHARFSEKIEAAIQDPKECNVKLKTENLDSAYPPIVQSGGVYDLKLSAQSDERNISFDAVCCPIPVQVLPLATRGQCLPE